MHRGDLGRQDAEDGAESPQGEARLITALLSAWLAAAAPAQAQQPALSRENAGVTDEFLVKLGTGAENYLTKALNDRSQEEYALGLVLRLEIIGHIDEPNPRIFRTLKAFIERQVRRNGDIGKTIEAVHRAFSVVGRRGGEEGADYLISWVADPDKLEEVRAFHWTTVEESREQIYRSAVQGLGLTGGAKADAVLTKLLASDHPRYEPLRDDLKSALEHNRLVQKDPLEGRYGLSRLKKMGLDPIYLQVREAKP